MSRGMRVDWFRRGVYPPVMDMDQTDGCRNMAIGLSDGHVDAADGDQTDDCRHSVFR